MRIFHVITLSSVGGAQSVVVNLANRQVLDNEVYVISSADGEAWKALDPRVRTIGIKQLHREISWRDAFVLLRLIWCRLRLRPDIVHLHSSKIGALGRIAFAPRKTLYTVHGFDSIRVANRKFLGIEKRLQRRCSAIVGVSRYDLDNLRAEGITHNVSFVYNGIADCGPGAETASPQAAARLKELRTRYEKIVMCIARDDAPKRMDLFLDTAARFPQYAFVWVGNGRDYDKPDNAVLLGRIPMADRLLDQADLFMLCSDFEGLPMSIIEALSHGKPVVASAVGGIAELLDGTNGHAVENRPEAFAVKIEAIFADNGRYETMSHAARATYERSFTIDSMEDGYRKIYDRINRK